MAEEHQQSLLQSQVSIPGEETSLTTPTRQSSRRGWMTGFFALLAIGLIAGQAVTVYFVFTQKDQIKTLQDHTDILKGQLRQQQKQGSVVPRMMHMPMMSLPLLMDDTDVKPKNTPAKRLEDTATVSIEKQVKDLLKQDNFPNFNSTFLENLNLMKKQMNETDWEGFQSWMGNWLLFQSAQKTPPKPTTPPQQEIPASQVQTKCQLQSGEQPRRLGVYRPQCDSQGNFNPKQCWSATGYCWCVDSNGDEIAGTRTRDPLNCNGQSQYALRGARMMAMPSLAKTVLIPDN
ncbi:H-2 class II histocompatibility antigen gamma chain-like [Polypterus senegalus]|uniref:H-2 class II histocompatibility antigen gamma chain-like n=1 Tax=Polypterus senegalus TaxID=55291 RepID=UPI0019647C0B|nr:H-2 class II histocompatibility antigen gamma chain-like [Polypterus senegalus]